MIKYMFFIFLSALSGSVYAQFSVSIQWQKNDPAGSSDTIYYKPGEKLTWRDFKGKPDTASPAAAITEAGFGYLMSMRSVNHKTTLVITVFCYFNRKHSWVKKNMDTDYALLHEQHHFDITYINASLFFKKLKETALNAENYSPVVEKIHDVYFNALDKMQHDYDGQTKNGRISNIQSDWNKRIDAQLAALPTN